MSKKGIVAFVVILALAFTGFIIIKDKARNTEASGNPDVASTANKKVTPKKKIAAKELHSDILRLIESSSQEIKSISKSDAKKELERRAGEKAAADQKTPNLSTLPFEILRLIANSPASIAGISSKQASEEIVFRSLVIDADSGFGEYDFAPSVLLESFKSHNERDAISKWAANEDAEAVEKFMKEEADRDQSNIANFVYGLKRLKDNHGEALVYLDRFARHLNDDEYDDDPIEKESQSKLKSQIEAIKHLK